MKENCREKERYEYNNDIVEFGQDSSIRSVLKAGVKSVAGESVVEDEISTAGDAINGWLCRFCFC